MTLPFSLTVTVRHTSLPFTGYSIRFDDPWGRLFVYWTESRPWRTFLTVAGPMMTCRPLGTL